MLYVHKKTQDCPQTTTFLNRKESRSGIEPRRPSAYQPNALPLGHTGSHFLWVFVFIWWCQVGDLNELLPVGGNDGAKLICLLCISSYIFCCNFMQPKGQFLCLYIIIANKDYLLCIVSHARDSYVVRHSIKNKGQRIYIFFFLIEALLPNRATITINQWISLWYILPFRGLARRKNNLIDIECAFPSCVCVWFVFGYSV